jgi:hypothetical protein
MNRSFLTLLLASSTILATASCGNDTTDSLQGGPSRSGTPSPSASVAPATDQQAVDQATVAATGSPEVTSRLHGCGKLSVASIGQLLQSRGLTGKGQLPKDAQSGVAIYGAGDTAASLGAANYAGRAAEAAFASTSAISKEFDIFTMASYDVLAPDWAAPACPGVQLFAAGKFTKDGISCLIGKPATDQHVAIANDAIANNPTDGAKIATAALLSAAHTCQ